jgi:hypothetical protein
MERNQMTPELLSSLAAIALSLAASYLPGFSPWYGALPGEHKRLLMLGLLAAAALACYGLACAGLAEPLGLALSCDEPGALSLVRSFLAALVANQAAFSLTPRSRQG